MEPNKPTALIARNSDSARHSSQPPLTLRTCDTTSATTPQKMIRKSTM